MPDDDIIKAVLRTFAADYPDSELRAREVELRRQWGGSSVYIPKEKPTVKSWVVGDRLAAGATLREAFEAAGCSQASGYRALRRLWRRW